MESSSEYSGSRKAFLLVSFFAATILTYQAIRIWLADYRVKSNRIDQMERGVALEPENAAAWDRLGRARETIAERFFSADEVPELRALRAELQAEGFFNCWTRKEAYVKARGGGLQIPLDSFGVVLTPGTPVQFVRGVEACWNLIAFTPGPNYVAALAFDGSPCKIRFFDSQWLIRS
jgi:hypothetical protein